MKQTLPLFCNFRNALCAAGIASVLGVTGLCALAYADSAHPAGVSQSQAAAAQTADVSAEQLQELSSAAGQSTSQLVGEIEDSLAQGGIAASYVDPSADDLPVVPYALGAATAVLGIGVFAGVFAGVRRIRHMVEDSGESTPFLQRIPAAVRCGLDDTASFMALLDENSQSGSQSPAVPAERPAAVLLVSDANAAHGSQASPSYTQDPLASQMDELESFAMGYAAKASESPICPLQSDSVHACDAYEAAFAELNRDVAVPEAQPQQASPKPDPDDGPGGPSAPRPSESRVAQAFSNTDLTLPFDKVGAPQSVEEFTATARAIAMGTGKVHRVNTPSDHLDFSGMDVLNMSASTYHDTPAANPLVDYDDWRAVALSELQAKPSDSEEGPRLSTEELVGLIQTQSQPARTPKRPGFVAPVIGPGIDPVVAARRQEMMRASSSPAATLLVNRDDEFIARRRGQAGTDPSGSSTDAVPLGDFRRPQGSPAGRPGPAAGASSLMNRVGIDVQSRGIPAASSFVAPQPPSYAGVVSDRGLAAAVAAASNAYAAFKSYTDVVSSPVLPAEAGDVSRAAMYASAVYGAPEQPGAGAPASYGAGSQAAQPCDAPSFRDDETGSVGDAYIDYIVQDEFNHRHDSLSQRNAALGRIQVVSGSACPIPLRESARRHRA